MAKRTFAVLAILLGIGMLDGDARAQMTPVAVDGCAKLARVIYTEVSASATYGPGRSGPWLIDLGQGDISVCKHASRTVSRAFTSAMMSAGFDVNWRRDDDDGPADPGDYCLSHYLSQCYPKRYPYPVSGFASSSDLAMIGKSWAAVSQAVMREMYNPISSDEVRFRESDLKLRLGLALRSVDSSDMR